MLIYYNNQIYKILIIQKFIHLLYYLILLMRYQYNSCKLIYEINSNDYKNFLVAPQMGTCLILYYNTGCTMKIYQLKARSYKEVVDFVISQILMASSNVRSVSLITPRGTLRQFRMREDLNLLLNTKEMDTNTLFVGLEKMEQNIPTITKYIIRLLQQNELTYDYG